MCARAGGRARIPSQQRSESLAHPSPPFPGSLSPSFSPFLPRPRPHPLPLPFSLALSLSLSPAASPLQVAPLVKSLFEKHGRGDRFGCALTSIRI